MWNASIPFEDSMSVVVRRSDIMRVRALFEDLAEGDLKSTKTSTPASLLVRC